MPDWTKKNFQRLRDHGPRDAAMRWKLAREPNGGIDMAFELPDLPYAANALEPHFDAETMRIHHGAHHRTYVEKLNAALDGTELADRPIEELLRHLDQVPESARTAVRNNGGGHHNHLLWWPILNPNGGGQPAGELATAIDRAFGSTTALQGELTDAAVARFGSGWAWLALDGERLLVLSTANQDSPLTDGLVPLLGVDVWEHAYYLRYQNKRPAYLEAWWKLVDWGVVADRYTEAMKKSAIPT